MPKLSILWIILPLTLASCATHPGYVEPSMDDNFLFSLQQTEYNEFCREAEKITIKNNNRYGLKNDKSLIIGENSFIIPGYKTCVEREGIIHLNIITFYSPENPQSLKSSICSKFDENMNLISWKPYC